VAVDLQAGLNVPEASLLNYESVVAAEALLTPRPLCLVGRGLGALVARMAARRVEPDRLVLIDPLPPVGGPAGTRPESKLALAESRRVVEVPEPKAPTLVLEGKIEPAKVVQWAG
jgi:hypothetical protein